MGFVNIGGNNMFYHRITGNKSKASLLFIHGSGGSHELWYRQMDLGSDCIALDLPGHGQTGGTPACSIDQSAQMVIDFVSALPVPRPIYLVGHSMGAATAITCALNYPKMIDALILIGAGHRMKVMPSFLDDLQQGKNDPDFIRLGFSSQAPAAVVEATVKAFGAVEPSVLYADFSACNNFDVSGELSQMGLPVLLIAGADDRLTPIKLAQYMYDHIANCRLEIINGAGHFSMLEKPEEVNRLILDFCQ